MHRLAVTLFTRISTYRGILPTKCIVGIWVSLPTDCLPVHYYTTLGRLFAWEAWEAWGLERETADEVRSNTPGKLITRSAYLAFLNVKCLSVHPICRESQFRPLTEMDNDTWDSYGRERAI